MDYSEDSKRIKVGAIFKGGEITPKWFIWENRKVIIREINYAWLEKQGRDKIYCFSVSDESNNYEIAFNAEQITWTLNKIFNDLK